MNKADLIDRYNIVIATLEGFKTTEPYKYYFYSVELTLILKQCSEIALKTYDWSDTEVARVFSNNLDILEDAFNYIDTVMIQDATSFDF